ncbi:ABC transporter ATP-binding protein [Lacticaseibacillus hulanensis]|uniref:ABC transporter ATP-binding protein n=1 Tax=Lacticaseibacillus hulanensis TaxID=2493111 RepID=UPI000FD7D0BF|nr:ABC transporter ATP-binding protein [Lacticaseibacillus hulanensis]
MAKTESLPTRYLRVVRVINQMDPWALPAEFAYAVSRSGGPYINIAFLGILLNRMTAGTNLRALLPVMLWFLGLRFGIAILNFWLQKVTSDHQQLVNSRLDATTTEKLLTVSYANLDDPQMRADYTTAKRGTGSNGGLTTLLRHGFVDFFGLLVALGFAVSMFAVLVRVHVPGHFGFAGFVNSPFYLVVLVLLLLVPFALSVVVIPKGDAIIQAMMAMSQHVNAMYSYFLSLVENMQNGPLIRLYNARRGIIDEERRQIDAADDNFLTADLHSTLYVMWPGVVASLITGVLYVLVGLPVFAGVLTIGTAIMAVGYLEQFMTSFTAFMKDISDYNNMVGYLQYYARFLALPDYASDAHLPVEKRDDGDYAFEFHDVSFKYPGSDEWALRHVHLELHVGERLAIVGLNGSGKTTLVKLLTRLYTPTSGQITLNDIDIQKYDEAEYRGLLAVVFQDFKLFAYSIAENVAASSTVDRDRVWQALDVADVADRVRELPHTIDTPVGTDMDESGVQLSGGEAQKVAIARAWYKDAPLVILDEPTAALDPLSEYAIYQRFDQLIGNKTAIYISHRMSSTRFAQRIAVFKDGELVEMGNHESLMAAGGLYKELFSAQAQYYQK